MTQNSRQVGSEYSISFTPKEALNQIYTSIYQSAHLIAVLMERARLRANEKERRSQQYRNRQMRRIHAFLPHATLGNLTAIEHQGSDDTISLGEIASQHSRRRISRSAQLLCLFKVIDRVIRLAFRHRVHEVAPDTVHARVLNDHCVTTGAALLDIGTVAIWVAVRATNSGAHVLDPRAWLLTDPHQKHGFDGCEVSLGFRVVAFGDALPVTAVEQVMTHDPAAAFTIGGFKGMAV